MTGSPVRRAHRWTTWMAAVAACALGGCTFGDEPQQAKGVVGGWFDDNCVPAECMLECCQGWNYSQQALFHGGSAYGLECRKVAQKNSAYADYVTLMLQPQNWCTEDFKDLESGYCYVIEPPDAVEGFRPDGQVVYAGLSFLVCPPRGQHAGHPLEDVELIPQE